MNRKYFYYIAGLTVCSEYCLGYALEAKEIEEIDVVIREGKLPEYESMMREGSCGGAGMLYRYDGKTAVYCYEKQGVFQVSDGKLIEYQVGREADSAWVEQVLLCQCFGGLISQRGMIGIHSSVCTWKEKAFVICGDSGAGKSTLTANLLCEGAKYMADDLACVEVNGGDVLVKSLVPLRKLCIDTTECLQYSGEGVIDLVTDMKKGVTRLEEFHVGSEILQGMFYLKKGEVEQVQCRQIYGAEKLQVLTRNFYAPGGYDEAMKEPAFVAKLFVFCNKVPMFEIVRPEDADSTKQCLETVKELLLKMK